MNSIGPCPSNQVQYSTGCSGGTSAISGAGSTKLPLIGEGRVIPRNSHFIDLEGGLKVPAGISLHPQDRSQFISRWLEGMPIRPAMGGGLGCQGK
jgi:hypothetical protein